MSISALLLTKNEEQNLPRLLASAAWVDEIIIVDDQSTDRTRDLAAQYHARIIVHPLDDFSSQLNRGLKAATGEWILRLDADEEIPPASAQALRAAARDAGPTVGGFRVLRRNYVLGTWLRHAQEYGKKVHWYDIVRRARGLKTGKIIGGAVKLFRRQGSRYVNLVHEEIEVPGRIEQLQTYVNHYTAESIRDLFDKVNAYTTLHARQLYSENPARLPRHFYRLLLWSPIQDFVYHYLRKLGCLDGFPGLMRCAAGALYEFLKYAKLRDYYPRKEK